MSLKTRLFTLLGVVSLVGLTLSAQAGPIQVSSNTQVFEPSAGSTHFSGNVLVAMEGTQITGPDAQIQMGKDGQAGSAVFTNHPKLVRSAGQGGKQTIQADTMKMGLNSQSLEASGNVTTHISGDKSAGNVSITSDSQTFDQERNIMKAIGHVSVKKDDINISSPEALVFMGSSGSPDKAVFIHGARLVQGGQEMKAETITIKLDTGDIYAEKNAQTSVNGKDDQGHDTKIKVTSLLQEVNKATGTLIANGNAVITYDDYIAKGPKAIFYRANNKLDRIVLSGRAQIEDNDRKVSGDKVIITVDPKQFNAEGNVTTFIKTQTGNAGGSSKSTAKAATTNASKKTASASAPAAPKKSATQEAVEQELLIEQATSGKVQ